MKDTVYSESFIFDCADVVKVYKNETLQLIKKALDQKRLQIWIFENENWLDTITSFKNGTELEQSFYEQIMAWFSGSRFRKLPLSSNELPKFPDCKCSSIWLETEEQEQQIINYLDERGLLSLIKDELLSNKISWLFKVGELPTITYGKPFNWNDYLAPYAHYTRKIYIFDRYFYYHWHQPIRELTGEFMEMNPELHIEIVGELEEDNHNYFNALKNIDSILNAYPRVTFYKFKREIGKKYHDRYLMTDYCLIKSEPGFSLTKKKNQKSIRETTPTLIGRYSSDNHKWRNEYFSWDQKKIEIFSFIKI